MCKRGNDSEEKKILANFVGKASFYKHKIGITVKDEIRKKNNQLITGI